MENVNTAIVNKFGGLVSYLTQTKSAFEMVADEIADSNLKVACNGLSEESLQYADELTYRFKKHGISGIPLVPYAEDGEYLPSAGHDMRKGDEVLLLCSTTENHLTSAYRDILNDYFPFPDIKEVMIYQLKALIFSFMKIRLLNLNRFLN